jgi:hypothetical protein
MAQKERWRVMSARGFGSGGTLATAGNLVFHGAIAYNADTGEKLWETELGRLPEHQSATCCTADNA